MEKPNIGNPRILLSLLLGGIFGVSVYSYWLVDILPPASLRILVCSFLAGFIGAVGYFFLLELWVVPGFAKLQKAEKWWAALWGVIIGLVLMFAGTRAWASPARYLTFLLPGQDLKITIPVSNDVSAPEVSIFWLNTSLGDVSYDSIQFDGWVRDGDLINLKNPSNNILRWHGRTGAEILILFRKSPAGGPVIISWNGKTETINLKSPSEGTFQYKHQFSIPFYASSPLVWLIVAVNFIMMGIALCILLFIKKPALDESIKRSVALISTTSQQQKPSIEIIPVAFFILLALLLRVFNLENLYPYADEYTHLVAAKELLAGASLNAVYQRSLFIVTLPVVASYSIFVESLWAARLPGVIFNALAIIPLYLITRKINRQVAVLSCLLFATSPYIIAFSRNIREYAYYPFCFYWVIYFMVLFLQEFPREFVLFRDWKKLQWKNLVLLLPVFLPIPYVLYFDHFSTLKLILIAYGIFSLFLFAKFDPRNWSNRFVIVIASLAAFAVAEGSIQRFLRLPDMDLRSLKFFFMNPPQQWYFDRLVIVPVLVMLAGFYFAYILRRATFIPNLLSVLYIGYMSFFIFFFKETGFNVHPRFVLAAQVWFVPILAMGMYVVWVLLRLLFSRQKAFAYLSACAIIISAFNVRQVLWPTFFRGEYMPITNLIHDDLSMANDYLLEHVNGNEVLIGSLYANYVQWQEKPAFAQIYPYSNVVMEKRNMDGLLYITSIIEQYPSGWIVIDEQRLDYVPTSLPKGQIVIQERTVEYVGKFLSQHIWRWSVK